MKNTSNTTKILLCILLFISFDTFGQESSCNDGIDNDGDGLIDCYDTDECGESADCANFYFGQPIPNCQGGYDGSSYTFALEKSTQTDTLTHPIEQRHGTFVFDMDGDGDPDVVGVVKSKPIGQSGNNPKIQIFDGKTFANIGSIPINSQSHGYSAFALGDVDSDGKGDIFIVTSANSGINAKIARYEFDIANPTPPDNGFIWQSDLLGVTNGDEAEKNGHMSVQLADFNNDGIPEVYVGNSIFDAVTGDRKIDLDLNKSLGRSSSNSNSMDAFPLAFDIDGDGDLELITGDTVYQVVLGAGADNGTLVPYSYIGNSDFSGGETNVKDGFVSIADINDNGIADVVVTAKNFVFAWEPLTEGGIGTPLASPIAHNGSKSGRACLGNVDTDSELEVAIAGQNLFKLYDYVPGTGFVEKWSKSGLKDGSSQTGATLFDFEGDGKNEIVYSDETTLYIWDGLTGNIKASTESKSGTRSEYPLVVDIDQDGQAEIITTAQSVSGPGDSGRSFIARFETTDKPWVTAREIWNQHGFFNTNINPNGTIPRYQQNHFTAAKDDGDPTTVSVLNGFLAQGVTMNEYGKAVLPTRDLQISVANPSTDIVLTNCPTEVSITFTIDNTGDAAVVNYNLYISIYQNNPTLAGASFVKLDSVLLANLNPGSSLQHTATFTLPIGSGNNGDIYVTINDKANASTTYPIAMPTVPLMECNYDNNLYGPIVVTSCSIVIDNDNDGIDDKTDLDSDNDGILDSQEDGGTGIDPSADTDLDNTPNYLDTNIAGFTDANNDGVDDRFDSDLDGIPNFLDLDSDNDGIPDVIEIGGTDHNGDGRLDSPTFNGNTDDTDNNGLLDILESSGAGTSILTNIVILDTDGDGIDDIIDLDSDNDGIPDVVEILGADSNGDGRLDNIIDTDNDGLHDIIDSYNNNNGFLLGNALVSTTADTDNNGFPDPDANGMIFITGNADNDPFPNFRDIDSDNDGISDIIEAGGISTNGKVTGFIDINMDGLDDDGSLVLTATDDNLDGKADSWPFDNTDGDNQLNFLDIDADNDGILDITEALPDGASTTMSGIDSDNDGLDNNFDTGNFISNPINSDNPLDAIPDYLDLDTDEDGALDYLEGFNDDQSTDLNSINDIYDRAIAFMTINPSSIYTTMDSDTNGIYDWFEDTDGDKIPNFLDPNNLDFYLDSDNDGLIDLYDTDLGGSPSSTPNQNNIGLTDFRDNTTVIILPVTIISFNVSKKDKSNHITWSTTNESEIQEYVIEKSDDGHDFYEIAFIEAVNGVKQNYEYLDTEKNENLSTSYYRIKILDQDNISYTNIISIASDFKLNVTTYPNPSTTTIGYTANSSLISATLIDLHGRTIKSTLHYNTHNGGMNVDKVQSGTYTLKLITNKGIYTSLIIIQH